MGCGASSPSAHEGEAPGRPAPARPAKRVESPEQEAARERRVQARMQREAAEKRMVEQLEGDAAAMAQIEEELKAELKKGGLESVAEEEWPPRPCPTGGMQLNYAAQWEDVQAFKLAQRRRYVRQCYETAVLLVGMRMMVRQGWRPWNHCFVVSQAARREIVYLFTLWKLRKSDLLSSLPRDVLFVIFGHLTVRCKFAEGRSCHLFRSCPCGAT